MPTTVAGVATSIISQDIEAFTLPFEFELRVAGGFDSKNERDPAQLTLLIGAWSVWWSQFALDLASPEEDAFPGRGRPRVVGQPAIAIPREGAALEAKLWDLGLVHPSEIAGPGGGMEYRLVPLSKRRDVSGEFTLEERPLFETIRRDRRPGPDEGFAFTLVTSADVVKYGAQLFCVGIPWPQWQLTLPNGVHPFDLVLFEVGFNEFEAWIGSANTKGSGWVKSAVTTILIPLLIAVSAPQITTEVERGLVRHEVSTRINSTYGSDCHVKGHITLNLSNLISTIEEKLHGNTKEDICVLQTALFGVGENPGKIDGIYGPNTRAAEQAFRNKWGLQGIARGTPQFSSALIKALRGTRPSE